MDWPPKFLVEEPLGLDGVTPGLAPPMGDPLTATARTAATMVKSFAENIMVLVDEAKRFRGLGRVEMEG